MLLQDRQLESLFQQRCKDPHAVLGMHIQDGHTVVRALLPGAEQVTLIEENGQRHQLHKTNYYEVFDIHFPDRTDFFQYTFEIIDFKGDCYTKADPYSFLPSLDTKELYYFNEGTETKLYKKLGAHFRRCMGVEGVSFTVWAPEAEAVFLTGDFNGWHSYSHPMRMLGSSGVWEIFLPEAKEGQYYKYKIKTKQGYSIEKADPLSFWMELRPGTSSRLWKQDKYQWNDEKWLEKRLRTDWRKSPISIYEMHLGSWKRKAHADQDENAVLSYVEYVDELIPYLKKTGFTHVEFMPLTEYPFDGSWGYQVSGYYAPTSRYGNPDELKYLIDRLHQEDIGVLFDWVPAHFPKDAFSLARFDGSALYEHEDPRQGEHPQWGTLIFNYGRTEIQSFLISNAFYWIDEFHIDGLRVDAVSSMIHLNYGRESTGDWVPNKYGGVENLEAVNFLRSLNKRLHQEHPDVITMAEEATAWPCVSRPLEFHDHALGFDFKWNMGWMHDTLKFMKIDPLFRKGSHDLITFSMAYFYNENFILPLSHDEVVHMKGSLINKMSGDYMQRFAQVKLLYSHQYAHPGKKLLFMGAEIGQESEWAYKNSLDWFRLDYNEPRQINKLISDLNNIYKQEKPLWRDDFEFEGFKWLNSEDRDSSVYSFVRMAGDEHIICIFNYTPVPRYNYPVGCPTDGTYKEIFNSDSDIYGGSNVVNFDEMKGKWISLHGQPHSLEVNVPPFGATFIKFIGD
jgi:1,4-alpha-glucan branching enzyme